MAYLEAVFTNGPVSSLSVLCGSSLAVCALQIYERWGDNDARGSELTWKLTSLCVVVPE